MKFTTLAFRQEDGTYKRYPGVRFENGVTVTRSHFEQVNRMRLFRRAVIAKYYQLGPQAEKQTELKGQI